MYQRSQDKVEDQQMKQWFSLQDPGSKCRVSGQLPSGWQQTFLYCVFPLLDIIVIHG
jgi:hypothetical protein